MRFLLMLFLFVPALAFLIEKPLAAEDSLRDYNSHSPFIEPEDVHAWEQRSANLLLQLQVSAGVHPQVALPVVHPDVYGKVERDGYSIQRMVFESLPGLKVTGSLFLPDPFPASGLSNAKLPAILCPHGHWNDARFRVAPDSEVKQQLASGAERYENAARHHIQARCVQLARMGCAVFHWDMLGYCDSRQLSSERAHGFARQERASEVNGQGWLLFSPEAELRMQSVLGLQTIATRRAVDAVLSLDFVDEDRIAITGASGGGTQSFIGAALDKRIACAFPAVMVSTGMQGGCTCENASLLRIGTSNAEIAALVAPRPLGMTAADDWTREMETDGYPQIQKVFDLVGDRKDVALFPSLHFGHNFNHVSRVSMYGWMNEHLNLGFDEPVLERDFVPALKKDLTTWDEDHPQPAGGLEFERRLMKSWESLYQRQFKAADQQEKLRWLIEGWRVLLAVHQPIVQEFTCESSTEGNLAWANPRLGKWEFSRASDTSASQVVTIKRIGKESQDVFYYEALSPESQRLVNNPRLAAAYTYAYNQTHFAKQAKRLAYSLAVIQGAGEKVGIEDDLPALEVEVTASGAGAAVVLAAVFYMQETDIDVARVVLDVDPEGFEFCDVATIRDPAFQPGAMKYGGVSGLESLVKVKRL